LATYDPLSLANLARPEIRANPYPFYKQLRDEDPVHWDTQLGFWILTRYADVMEVLHDPRIGKAIGLETALHRLPEAERQVATPVYQTFARQMLYADPPYHTKLRSLVNKAFTPRMVEKMRPRVQQIADSLVDAVEARGCMDVVHDYAYPLPLAVILDLFGLPQSDSAQIKAWTDDFSAALGIVAQTPQVMQRASSSLAEFNKYICAKFDELEKNPKDDFLSALLQAGEQDNHLSRDELVANVLIVILGGHENSTNTISNSLRALFQHPEQMQEVLHDPSLVNSAVEETLRYDNSVQIVWRYAIEDLEVGGKRIEKGQLLNCMVGAANRDPAQFPDPDTFDIHRPEYRHLGFGMGVHFCVGMPLGRLDAQIGLGTLLRRLPKIHLTDTQLEWQIAPTFRGVKALPVAF